MTSSTATERPARRRSRWLLAAAGVFVVGSGLLLNRVPGPVGDLAGGILYAVLVFLLVALVVPAGSAARIGSWAFGLCAAVELFQLTGLPMVLGDVFPPARLVLGTTFVLADFLAYAVGVAAVVLTDLLLGRRAGRSSVSATGTSA